LIYILKIEIKQKFKFLTLEQTDENKYLLTLDCLPGTSSQLNEKTNDEISDLVPIVTQIELYPEDIIILKKFIDVSQKI